jgi:very-short-patch-repair endonuclease
MRATNPKARELRRNMPEAERRLWVRLKNRQLAGLRFRRQHPIGPYIVDFVCLGARLVVELDGGQHGEDDALAHDARRDRFIEDSGYRVLRFWNAEVARGIEDVLRKIHLTALDRMREIEALKG